MKILIHIFASMYKCSLRSCFPKCVAYWICGGPRLHELGVLALHVFWYIGPCFSHGSNLLGISLTAIRSNPSGRRSDHHDSRESYAVWRSWCWPTLVNRVHQCQGSDSYLIKMVDIALVLIMFLPWVHVIDEGIWRVHWSQWRVVEHHQ